MRDLLLLAFVFAGLLATLRFPVAGLILWAWFTLMTPHFVSYGAYGLPLNAIIAAVTFASMFAHGVFKDFRFDALTGLLLLFGGWLVVSQAFSLDPKVSALYFDRFFKTLLFAALVAQMSNSFLRFHAMLWILVIGIGYFAAKGGFFTLLTLGHYRVQGVEMTLLEDNNHLGIAIATMLPLMLYLRQTATRPIVRHGMAVMFAFGIVAILGTQSRGAFISLVVFSALLWAMSRHKAAIAALLLLLMAPAIAFMPSDWSERMSTITEAGEDESFMGRVTAWKINAEFAYHYPLTGGGLRIPYEPELIDLVAPELSEYALAAHSIYFEVLGGTGFVGLVIFLTLLGVAVLKASALAGSGDLSTSWRARFGNYARMSLLTFYVGGASVSMEMWDGYWLIFALISAASRLEGPTTVAHRTVRVRPWRMAARGQRRRIDGARAQPAH